MLLFLLAAVSCVRDPLFRSGQQVLVHFDCCCDAPDTKSAFTLSESLIRDWNVLVYNSSGQLVSSLYSGDGSTLRLVRNTPYRIYAVANLGRFDAPSSESSLSYMRHEVQNMAAINSSGLPMSTDGALPKTFTSASESLTITVVRLVAKYRFRIDKTALSKSDFTLSSMQVRNSSLDAMLFSSGSQATSVADFDYASTQDISTLNSGGEVSYYMLENACGYLLPGNTDQWNKIPDNIGANKNFCTYFEIKGTWTTEGAHSDITCRLYLGRNNCSDFNVDRNTVNSVVVTLSDDGMLRSNWKISRENIVDERQLYFSPSSIDLDADGEYEAVDIVVSPSSQQYSITASQAALDAADIDWYRSGDRLVLRSSYDGSGTPTAAFQLTTWDGVAKGTLAVNVHRHESVHYDISGLEDTYVLGKGRYLWPILEMEPCIPDESDIDIVSSDLSVISWEWDPDDEQQPLGIRATGSGFATLTVDYGTFHQVIHFYVPPAYTFTGLPSPYLKVDAGSYVTRSVYCSPASAMTSVMNVNSSSTSVATVTGLAQIYTEDFSSGGINYGSVGTGASFRVNGIKDGYARITCSTYSPSVSSTFQVYVIGTATELDMTFEPGDGRLAFVTTSTGSQIKVGTENGHTCGLYFDGDATVTRIEFDSYSKRLYHPDWSPGDYCEVTLDGESFNVGDVCEDLDFLTDDYYIYVKGSDCYVNFTVTLGKNGLEVPVRIKFASDYVAGDD